MNETLNMLIEKFRTAQDLGVYTLVHDLKIPQPESAYKWARYCAESNLYNTDTLKGVAIYAHGYGIKLKITSLTIDFDWGQNGEPDGFDGWRLYNFSIDNLPGTQCSHADTNAWIDSAFTDNELIKIGNLYFDPNRRATPPPK